MQDNPSKNLRAAIYARVSTEEQRQGQNIESQVNELEKFVSQKGWNVTVVYKDEGWSGSILARPQLDLLRDNASKKMFDVVLVNDVDRLARDVTHLGVIKRDLERRGVQVVFRKLPAESSPTHNLMVNILGSFAEFERELIADRTRRGRRYKVDVRKQFLGSIAPYGFRYVPRDRTANKEGYLEIISEEAAVVRQIYAWVGQEGLSARKVLTRLDQMKIRPRKGAEKWEKSSVLRILRSQVYAGVWHFNKHESYEPNKPAKSQQYKKSPKSSSRLRSRAEWLSVELPEHLRIIDRDQWRRVQHQLERNITFSPRNAKHSYMLKGLVRCGGCGATYVGDPHHNKFYYRCHRRCKKSPSIQEGHLNNTVWKAIKEAVMNPDLIADQVLRVARKKTSDVTKMQREAGEIEQSLKNLDAEEARILKAYRMGILSPVQLGGELEAVNANKASLENRRASVKRPAIVTQPSVVKKSIKDYCQLAAARLASFTWNQRQQFIRLLIRGIVFEGDRVRIKGRIPLNQRAALEKESLSTHSVVAGTDVYHCGRNPTYEIGALLANNLNSHSTHFVDFELERPIATREKTEGQVTLRT